MRNALIIHLQSPLMSFGTPQVDQYGPTGRFPTLSQVTGLFANALGYRFGDFNLIQSLQGRLQIASLLVSEGEELEDFQTVDLGLPHLRSPGWTTWGRTEHRTGGPSARFGTHIRLRRYRADATVVAAISLRPADTKPTLDVLADALTTPHRPLYIGRKPCLPSTRMVVGILQYAGDMREALMAIPQEFPTLWAAIGGNDKTEPLPAEWPISSERDVDVSHGIRVHRVTDQRDWRHQVHGGERAVARARLAVQGTSPEVSDA